MRMPLALHRASMSLGLGAFTALLRPIAISRRSRGIHWVPGQSREIAAQNKGCGAVRCRIISFSASDLPESGAAVKPACRYVALLRLEKNRTRPERRQSTQVGMEELPRQYLALLS